MESRKPTASKSTTKKVDKPIENSEKDENEVAAKVDQLVDKESFADRKHKEKRRHDSPGDISNPGTV